MHTQCYKIFNFITRIDICLFLFIIFFHFHLFFFFFQFIYLWCYSVLLAAKISSLILSSYILLYGGESCNFTRHVQNDDSGKSWHNFWRSAKYCHSFEIIKLQQKSKQIVHQLTFNVGCQNIIFN